MKKYLKRVVVAVLCLCVLLGLIGFIGFPVQGSVLLHTDVIFGKTLVIESDETFDLNGNTLRLLDSATGSVFYVKSGATLTITDSAGGGIITGGKALGGGTEDLGTDGYGGSVLLSQNDRGGGVYVESGGKLELFGGAITGNRALQGGGVFLECGAELCISGGARVADNYRGQEGTVQDNVWLPLDSSNLQSRIKVAGTLREDAKIGITTAAAVDNRGLVITSGLAGKGTVANFTSDIGKPVCLDGDGEAKLVTALAITPTIDGVIGQDGDNALVYGYKEGSVRVEVSSPLDDQHTLSYQWFACDDAEKTNPQKLETGGTEASYSIPQGNAHVR